MSPNVRRLYESPPWGLGRRVERRRYPAHRGPPRSTFSFVPLLRSTACRVTDHSLRRRASEKRRSESTSRRPALGCRSRRAQLRAPQVRLLQRGAQEAAPHSTSRMLTAQQDNAANAIRNDPQVGDIVLYPGRWREERLIGVVEGVTPRANSVQVITDIKPLERLGDTNKFIESSNRKTVWRTSTEIVVCDRVAYDPQNRVWTLEALPPPARSAPLSPEMIAERDQGLQEYQKLKRWLLQGTLVTSGIGVCVCFLRAGIADALAFAAGSSAGILYLRLLQRSVDRLQPIAGSTDLAGAAAAPASTTEQPRAVSVFSAARYAAPMVAILSIVLSQRGTLTSSQVFSCILGFLSYKIPLWYVSIRDYAEAARIAPASAARNAASQHAEYASNHDVASRRAARSARNLPDLARNPPAVTAIVVTGPSGVGKSTLIGRLLAEFPNHLGYSVSTTTRAPRPGEVDGVSYHFVSKENFLADVAAGKFIEYACVYGNYYGTTFGAVRAVTQSPSPRVCILSLDLQGAQTMMDRQELDAFYIWIAPPSLTELEQRLRRRETESPSELDRRLEAARQEMDIAEKITGFDLRIVNDDIEVAYEKMRRVVLALLHGRR